VSPIIPPTLSANVTTYAGQYQLGDLVTTPQTNNGSNPSTNPVPPGITVLGNWILRGILGTSVLEMFADGSGQASLTWNVGTVGGVTTILSFSVNNATGYFATINVILAWENPQTSLTFSVSVGPGGIGSSALPSNASAISSASISATTQSKVDIEERNQFLAKYQEKRYGIKLQKCAFPKSSARPDLTKLVSSLSIVDKKALAGMLKQECNEGEEEEKQGGKKGRLLGIITLSDVLRYVIGEVGIGESIEPSELPTPAPTPAPVSTPAREETEDHPPAPAPATETST